MQAVVRNVRLRVVTRGNRFPLYDGCRRKCSAAFARRVKQEGVRCSGLARCSTAAAGNSESQREAILPDPSLIRISRRDLPICLGRFLNMQLTHNHGQLSYVHLHEVVYHFVREFGKDDVMDVLRMQMKPCAELRVLENLEYECRDETAPNAIPAIITPPTKSTPLQHFLSLPPHVRVRFVDDATGFGDVIERLEQVTRSESPFVGVNFACDMHAIRWRDYGQLMQIALRDHVFVVSMTADRDHFRQLLAFVFGNEALGKFALRLGGHLRMFRSMGWVDLGVPRSFIEIRDVYNRLNHAALDAYAFLMIWEKLKPQYAWIDARTLVKTIVEHRENGKKRTKKM